MPGARATENVPDRPTGTLTRGRPAPVKVTVPPIGRSPAPIGPPSTRNLPVIVVPVVVVPVVVVPVVVVPVVVVPVVVVPVPPGPVAPPQAASSSMPAAPAAAVSR